MPGSIEGTVRTHTHRFVPDATVMIGSDSPTHQDLAALTSQEGYFQFDDLQTGIYEIIVSHEDFSSSSHMVSVSENNVAQLTIILVPTE